MLLNSCINWENSTLAVASLALACVILRAELRHHQQSFTSLALYYTQVYFICLSVPSSVSQGKYVLFAIDKMKCVCVTCL